MNKFSKHEPFGEFRVGRWQVLPSAGLLRNGQGAIHVRPKVMDLLVALAEEPGVVRSKDELLGVLWPDVVVADSSVAVTVFELREALGDDAAQPEYIRTIPRRGYQLIAPVTRPEHPLRRKSDERRPSVAFDRLRRWFDDWRSGG